MPRRSGTGRRYSEANLPPAASSGKRGKKSEHLNDRGETSGARQCPTCWVEANDNRHITQKSSGHTLKPRMGVSLDLRRVPNGQIVVILINGYLKFPVVETFRSTDFQDIRAVLEKVFALVGNPSVLDCEDVTPLRGHAI